MVSELAANVVFHHGAVGRVLDRVVQQAADRGILPAAVLEHQRRDRH